jgi:hypothetical protein
MAASRARRTAVTVFCFAFGLLLFASDTPNVHIGCLQPAGNEPRGCNEPVAGSLTGRVVVHGQLQRHSEWLQTS